MASIRKEITIDAQPDDAWAALRDFGALHSRLVRGFATDTRIDGQDRIVTFFNGAVARERLVDTDDDARRQISECRRYLADFEAALERSSAPAELIDRMTAAYPDLANPYTLWVAAYDLLGSRT